MTAFLLFLISNILQLAISQGSWISHHKVQQPQSRPHTHTHSPLSFLRAKIEDSDAPSSFRFCHYQRHRRIAYSRKLRTSRPLRLYPKSSSSSSASAPFHSTAASAQTAATDPYYYAVLDEQPPLRRSSSSSTTTSSSTTSARITLTRYLDQAVQNNPELYDLQQLLLAVQMACKTISNLVNRAGLAAPATSSTTTTATTKSDENTTSASTKNSTTDMDDAAVSTEDYTDGRFYSMQRLDQLSTLVLRNALRFIGKVKVVAPPVVSVSTDQYHHHQPGVLIAKSLDSSYVACLDPLDGSGNADASICTGTIFGVFQEQRQSDNNRDTNDTDDNQDEKRLIDSVLQPAKNMRAAGYCLYSSATVLVFTLGTTVQGFTLDPQLQEFVLTQPNLTIPPRGSVYSVNEANSEGWQARNRPFQRYLSAIKTGQGQSKKRYALRYVGSMVGDIHRTLLYGGVFCYPSDTLNHPHGNLQLLYKTAPLAYIVSTAGGRAITDQSDCTEQLGKDDNRQEETGQRRRKRGRMTNLLEVRPERVHQKWPCFMGSPEDVDELESYYCQDDDDASQQS